MHPVTDLALLVLRVVFGLSLAAHGAQKLFGWWGGPGLAGFAGWLGGMRMRSPRVAAALAAMSEFGGGLLFALGLLTPLAALAMVSVMLTAVATVHASKGFFVSDGGWEYNLSIVAVAVAVATSGPGDLSVDHALGLTGTNHAGWAWGLGVLAIGALATAVNLATRTRPEPLGDSEGGSAIPTA
jgi:putative oxidoreductase